MIERLQIKNFQAHEKLQIDLDQAVTVLTGPSDVGKSAAIRALRWLCTNSPGGDAFVKRGKKKCGVRLLVDGRKIERARGKSKNSYSLDGSEFKSFGANVPEQIESLLNVSPVSWQGQHDSPFWLAETAGQVGRELNAVVNMEVMDAVLSLVNGKLQVARIKSEAASEQLERVSEEVGRTDWVEEAKKRFTVLETTNAQREQALTAHARLESNASELEEVDDELLRLRSAEAAIGEVLEVAREFVRVQEDRTLLLGIIDRVEELKEVKPPDTTRLDEVARLLMAAAEERKEVEGWIRVVGDVKAEEEEAREVAENAFEKLNELTGGECPLCGSQMKETSG
jgi:DNA repair exonuclease SbcCD ATPase subunit